MLVVVWETEEVEEVLAEPPEDPNQLLFCALVLWVEPPERDVVLVVSS